MSSLKIRKFRDAGRQFLIEGDKIIRDALKNRSAGIKQLVATASWINANSHLIKGVTEVSEADEADLGKITSFETPPPVIAVIDMPEISPDMDEIKNLLTIGLDTVQDPGNMGTIIRTADWFGIRNILCSGGCADVYNSKVIQASMGAIFNVKVHYGDLKGWLKDLSTLHDFTIAGTFMQGTPLNEAEIIKKGLILFGNESKGISDGYLPFIKKKITIPAGDTGRAHVESLNVASSVAIVLYKIATGLNSAKDPP